jgi:transcriptional regulator with XRE-family HTH domain
MEELIMTVNERLRTIRQYRKLSTYDMAVKMNINQSLYYKVENGDRRLYVDFLGECATILEAPIEAFYYDEKMLEVLQGGKN